MEQQGPRPEGQGSDPAVAAARPGSGTAGRTQIVCLGVNFRTADLKLREALLRGWEQLRPELETLADCPGAGWLLREWLLLETCNRFELYAAIEGKPWAFEYWFLSRLSLHPTVERSRMATAFRRRVDFAAHEHLMRVASGLESMVLGETEVLGQVKKALHAAEQTGAAGELLSALFTAALQAGRRARQETDIGRDRSTVSSLAVSCVERLDEDLARRRVLVVGLGEVGHLTTKALCSRGTSRLGVSNRTAERARHTAERHGFEWWPLEQLDRAVAWADVVFTCTSSGSPLIGLDLLRRALRDRSERRLLLVDLAVPRNVDPSVSRWYGVAVLTLDDLGPEAAMALEKRRHSVPAVEAIVAHELEIFARNLRSLSVEPMIRGLRQRAETIRKAELERARRLMGEVEPEAWEKIEGLSRALVNKILHHPTARLRRCAVDGDPANHLRILQTLFDLDSSPHERRTTGRQ